MSKSWMVSKVGLLSCSMALAVMVGCQPPAVVAPAGEGTISTVKPGTVTGPTKVEPVLGTTTLNGNDDDTPDVVPTPVLTQDASGNAGITTNAANGTIPAVSGQAAVGTGAAPALGVVVAPASVLDIAGFKESAYATVARQALLAAKAKALAAEPTQAVNAAAGALVKSADGKLTATVPAGALTQNAEIKIVPMDPALFRKDGAYAPGILFAADLGGAALMPGTSITVAQRVDLGFINRVKAFDPAFTPDAYSLRQDSAGQWTMEMPIKGPTLGAGPAPAEPANPNLLEFGSLPGSLVTAPGVRTLMAALGAAPHAEEADVDVDNQALVDAVRDAGAPGCSIPLWLVIHNESLGVWGCGAVNHKEICWNEQSPPSKTYKVTARWESDDDAFKDKAAPGVAVHAAYTFEQWWKIVALQGATDLVTNTAGEASTFTALGSKVVLTASHPITTDQTTTVRANGPFTVGFSIPHYSPNVTLRVTNSDFAIPASLEVEYSLNGTERTETVDSSAISGRISGDIAFKVKVPGEAYYPMVMLNVRSANGDLRQAPSVARQTQSVRANGTGLFTTELQAIVAK